MSVPCPSASGNLTHIGANLIPDSVFKPMSKNQNDDNDYLRLFSIVFFAVESDSSVKWSLKMGSGAKKEDFEAQKSLENEISDLLACLATFLAIWTY